MNYDGINKYYYNKINLPIYIITNYKGNYNRFARIFYEFLGKK